MNFTKATDKQLKTIIEWDIGVPTHLLKEVYEEIMGRRILDNKIYTWIFSFFKSKANAETKTGMATEDLLWICYELGYEILDNYKPDLPFIAYWYRGAIRKIKDIARNNTRLKRSCNKTFSWDDMEDWKLPAGNNNTETTAINRVYIESLMSRLREVEKEIVIMRYLGYANREIGARQGVSRQEIENRMKRFRKRLKGA